MVERKFGSVNAREVHIRLWVPFDVTTYCPTRRRFCITWRKLVNPANWWRAVWCRAHWAAELRTQGDANHRCYCPVGRIASARVVVCGFGFIAFYSHCNPVMTAHPTKPDAINWWNSGEGWSATQHWPPPAPWMAFEPGKLVAMGKKG